MAKIKTFFGELMTFSNVFTYHQKTMFKMNENFKLLIRWFQQKKSRNQGYTLKENVC